MPRTPHQDPELTEDESLALARRGYVLEQTARPLGRGGYGVVYRGTWNTTRPIAVKHIDIKRAGVPAVLMEIFSLKTLKHPNVVRVLDFFLLQSGHLLIIMEYLGGGTLNWLLDSYSLFEWQVAILYRQFGSGLAFMHNRGLAHRDLKPGNILLDEHWMLAKLADFGLSRICYDQATGTPLRTHSWAGTEIYMAPEVLAHRAAKITGQIARPPDYCPFLADVWSMGIITYELFHGAGTYPYRVKNPQNYLFIHRKYFGLSAWWTIMNLTFDRSRVGHAGRHFVRRHLKYNATERPEMDDLMEDEFLLMEPPKRLTERKEREERPPEDYEF